jgi:hypothetical protein
MPCARPDVARIAFVVALVLVAAPRAVAAAPSADEILIAAERQRGLGRPHIFAASIAPQSNVEAPADVDAVPRRDRVNGTDTASAGNRATAVTRVEVRSNGFAQQLVIVLEPSRGDAMLSTPDVVWLRPRRLHRLTRIPPELRMFSAASVGDVTAIDVVATYAATLADAADAAIDAARAPYRLDLTARRDVRYPRASYTIARDDLRPLQIDFMAASGKVLKTVTYGKFAHVFDRVIPTEVVVHDHVYRDGSIVRLSDFRTLSPVDPAMFTPDYLLTLGDDT